MTNHFPPQTEKAKGQKLVILKERCGQNHRCPAIRRCPQKALSQNDFNAPIVDELKCIRCGKCIRVCPKGAFTIR